MVVEAKLYLEKVVDNRRNPDAVEKALTVRTAIGKAHATLYQKGFQAVIEKRFGTTHLYGDVKPDPNNMVNYAQSFKRYFFRIVKAIGDGKRGRTLGSKTIQRRMMRLPATYMVAGSASTNNARVNMNRLMAQKLKGQV